MLPYDRNRTLDTIRRARRCLEKAQEELDSAGRWGVFDMLGGRMLSGLIKHGRIDEARRWIDEARPLLRRLRETDWDDIYEPGTGPSEMATLADFLFDGLFADLFVQSRIRQLQDEIRETLRQLDRLERAVG